MNDPGEPNHVWHQRGLKRMAGNQDTTGIFTHVSIPSTSCVIPLLRAIVPNVHPVVQSKPGILTDHELGNSRIQIQMST